MTTGIVFIDNEGGLEVAWRGERQILPGSVMTFVDSQTLRIALDTMMTDTSQRARLRDYARGSQTKFKTIIDEQKRIFENTVFIEKLDDLVTFVSKEVRTPIDNKIDWKSPSTPIIRRTIWYAPGNWVLYAVEINFIAAIRYPIQPARPEV